MKTLIELLNAWPFTPDERDLPLWNYACKTVEEGDRRLRLLEAAMKFAQTQLLNIIATSDLDEGAHSDLRRIHIAIGQALQLKEPT